LPELPEVETTRKGIEPFLIHNKISSVEVRQSSLRWPISIEIYDIRNLQVCEVLRRGKYIIVRTDNGSILIHLGMSGSLRVVEPQKPLEKHDHVDIKLNTGKILRFNDPRRFGSILWANVWQEHKLISSLGIEPLTPKFTGDYLYQLGKNKKIAIKQFIMNGKLVVGVGNIYANESLFLAGIDPRRPINGVSRKRVTLLVEQIKNVLQDAISKGGTTLKDFVGSDGKPGYFQQQLFVYGRAGQPCLKCQKILQEVKQNNRSTVFCSHCQS